MHPYYRCISRLTAKASQWISTYILTKLAFGINLAPVVSTEKRLIASSTLVGDE